MVGVTSIGMCVVVLFSTPTTPTPHICCQLDVYLRTNIMRARAYAPAVYNRLLFCTRTPQLAIAAPRRYNTALRASGACVALRLCARLQRYLIFLR